MRICGRNITDKSRVVIGLRQIYGIGPTRAMEICRALNIPDNVRIKELSPEKVNAIDNYVEKKFVVEVALKTEVFGNIDTNRAINCWKGKRITAGLPTRGQKAKSNARTAKKLHKALIGGVKA